MVNGAERILAERLRQIEVEGFGPEHDDAHDKRQLMRAAHCYLHASDNITSMPPMMWPWDGRWWKPSNNRIRNLERAGALIAAEIDRLQRLEGTGQ